ncbi:MAG: hypothetical protein H7A24_16585 [Leptospiraceae bacterium]|nr:hypothetical protein [Leptospiraceae bacterium]
MATVEDYANEFINRRRKGYKPSVFVNKKHLYTFLTLLEREGYGFSTEYLNEIEDDEIRKILKTIFYSTVTFATAGATLGFYVGGGYGAGVGAIAGASLGYITSVSLIIIFDERKNGLQISCE